MATLAKTWSCLNISSSEVTFKISLQFGMPCEFLTLANLLKETRKVKREDGNSCGWLTRF
ncbi:hypothetical protein D0Y65_024458 [Glycine soja]|uniref:Uncharacterized protein n=1 Tax=Glycine soja TaxID=3848 RepID=A0A445J280_GLYSO|nr:hypothetical protein D0Y65_024458 [Glycine soja]